MTKVRRVDFYPDDFMVGVIGMPPDEIGAYWVVCCLIYSRGGPIDDDPKWLATACNCHVLTWKRLRAALIDRGKLVEISPSPGGDGVEFGPRLSNVRAEKELSRARDRAESARRNGNNGGRPPKQNNDLPKPGGLAPGLTDSKANKQQPAIINHQSASSSSSSSSSQRLAQPAGQPEIDRVGEAACRAAGFDIARLAVDLAVVGNWLRAGYDPEREVLPAIRGVAARSGYVPPKGGLKYFTGPIADFRATLQAPAPKGEARNVSSPTKREWWDKDGPAEGTPEWWDARVAFWIRYRERDPKERPWDGHWGPQPDQPKCRAPGDILVKHGLRNAA